MGVLKKILRATTPIKLLEKPFKTGKSAALRSAQEAADIANEQARGYQEDRKKSMKKAQKLRMAGLRSRRGGAYFDTGSETIG
jgi:hypothetical protein